MEVLTYSLRNNRENSDLYYKEIPEITDIALNEAEKHFSQLIDLYINYLEQNRIEKLRSREEYIYELMSIGVYFSIYAERAGCLNKPVLHILSSLVALRRDKRNYKDYIDIFRGILATLFLDEKITADNITAIPSVKNIRAMVLFLEATGEFREEVKRFGSWMNFFETGTIAGLDKYLINLTKYARWFTVTTAERLSKYTTEVHEYHLKKLPEHRWKEDYLFCARKEAEYHLSMVGAEIMNRAFRYNFSKTKKKAVLAPACMRDRNAEQCKAKKNSLDLVCTGCSTGCRINQLTKLGKENGFDVHIIPHSSDFSKWLETWGKGKDIGVIGVACILNLITGGYELKNSEIAAQCVLLDFCGCRNHWDKNGFATELNISKLLEAIHGTGVENDEEDNKKSVKWN